jgi:hypothetical protein
VKKLFSQLNGFDSTGRVQHLFTIHATPSSSWPMLASLLQSNDWSVKDTKAAVDRIKEVSAALPAWFAAPVNLEKAAMEPGFAKALVASLKVMDGCHARLPESVTVYALVPTDETPSAPTDSTIDDTDARKCCGFTPQIITLATLNCYTAQYNFESKNPDF